MLEGIVLRKLRSNQRLEAMTRRMAHRMGHVRGSLHKRRAPPYGPVVFRSSGAVARGAQQSTLSLKCLSDFQACERETRSALVAGSLALCGDGLLLWMHRRTRLRFSQDTS